MLLKIKTSYKSSWYVMILPTLQFVIILFGLPMIVGFLSENTFWAALSLLLVVF